MKRYYISAIIALISIVTLQSLYVKSLYMEYYNKQREKIESCIYKSLDVYAHREYVLHHSGSKVEYKKKITPLDEMSDKMRDSILAIHPLPTTLTSTSTPTKTYNLWDLMETGAIRSFSDTEYLLKLDVLYERGIYADAVSLDSLFNNMLDSSFITRVYVYGDGDNDILSHSCGSDNSSKYNYQSDLIPISANKYQNVRFEVYVAPSSFYKEACIFLLLSLLSSIILIGILIYLTIAIERRDRQSRLRELEINGIIHDLKSPLNSVASMLDYYRLSETNKDKVETARTNRKSIELLTMRVNYLLNALKSKSRHSYIEKKRVDMISLQERTELIVSLLKYKYLDKKMNIQISANGDAIINIDLSHYDSILMNLIDNSLKYSNEDVEIVVEVSCKSAEILTINVKDNGFGVKTHDFNRVFRSNYRSKHEGIEGFGVGLPYVKYIANLHNGGARIVNSIVGKGSEFEVTFNIE